MGFEFAGDVEGVTAGPTVHIPAGRLAAVTAGSYCILQHITGHSLISQRGCITISCVELLRACAA